MRGNLELSKDLAVGIQIFTKTKEESIPSLKKYSKAIPESNDAGAGKITAEKTFHEVDDPDQKEVNPDQFSKAYNYGKQLVPVTEENEHQLKGKKQKPADEEVKGPESIQVSAEDEREFKLLGFTNASSVPRQHFMAGVDVILPIKGDKNERAFAAMVNAMTETGKVLLAKLK